MSSNTMVMVPAMFASKKDGVSEESHLKSIQEARENVTTAVIQNILFYPMKLKILLPILLYGIFKMGDDDDDEAAIRAQEATNYLFAPDAEKNPVLNLIDILAFGKKREFFQLDRDTDEAQASAVAEVLGKTSLELATAVPYVGVLAGYSPVQGLISKMLTDDLSEYTAAKLSGEDRNSVNIREARPTWIERGADLTAPTGTAYDFASASKLAVDYNLTREAEKDRLMSLVNTLAYLATEAIPFARESRSYMQGVLKEPVKEEAKKKNR
jgi:hypothetical protein